MSLPRPRRDGRMTFERARAALITLGLVAAAASPAVPDAQGVRHDGYPLSWYPMFSSARPAVEALTWVRAVLADGSDRPVAVWWWTSGGLSEGRNQLERAVKAGEGPTRVFCEQLATKFAARSRGWESRVVELRITNTRWRLTRYFTEPDPQPERTRVVATCPVSRG